MLTIIAGPCSVSKNNVEEIEEIQESNKEEAEILLYGNKVKYKYYMSNDTDAEETRKKISETLKGRNKI